MKRFSLSIAIIIPILFASCLSGKVINSASVQPLLENSAPPANSIIYALPKTMLRIEVEVEKTASKTGPFANYAERYLNISNVITQDKVEYRIKAVHVIEKGIADKSRRYAVTAKGDAMAQYIALSDDGVLLGVNTPKNASNAEATTHIVTDEITSESISFDSVPLREKHLKATSIPMMAELVANSIYKYRKRQSKLLGFEYDHHPCDAATLEMSVTELKKQEIAYTEMFTGKSLKQNLISSFDIMPDSISIGKRVLFYFSPEKGITNEANGEPIYYEYRGVLADKTTSTAPNKVTTQGLYYCVPAKIDFKLTYLDKIILAQKFDIAQLGSTLSLPAELIAKPNVLIEINPTNGALKRIGKIGEQ